MKGCEDGSDNNRQGSKGKSEIRGEVGWRRAVVGSHLPSRVDGETCELHGIRCCQGAEVAVPDLRDYGRGLRDRCRVLRKNTTLISLPPFPNASHPSPPRRSAAHQVEGPDGAIEACAEEGVP